jgi:hypothetical protein
MAVIGIFVALALHDEKLTQVTAKRRSTETRTPPGLSIPTLTIILLSILFQLVFRRWQMTGSKNVSQDDSTPRTTVFITDWAGSFQSRLVFYPPEIKHNHTLNIVIGPDGAIAREEDMEIL